MKGHKNVYIFIGPPGSGKGTLSHLCVKMLGWVQLSTGNLCRKHVAEHTQIGKQIDFALKSGNLVSDELISAMVNEWFTQTIQEADNIILDGYPRTIAQAKSLYTFLTQTMPSVTVTVIRFFIADEAVVSRICGRLICQNKDCQEVYSMNPGARHPAHSMRCDTCSAELGRRNDDAVASVRDRLHIYHKHEQELIHFYEKTNFALKSMDVEKPIDQVFEDFKMLVGYSAT